MSTYTQLKCPLTGLYFSDPVVSDEGIIYERIAIEYSIKNGYISNKKLIPVPIIKDIISTIDSNDKFYLKLPYYLFRTNFIKDLTDRNVVNLLKYTEIVLTDIFDPIKKLSVSFQLFNSDLDNKTIFHLINNSIDYDVFDFNSMKLIHYASIYSNQDIIRFLIDDKKVSINDKDPKGNLPVHNIAKYFIDIDKILDVFSNQYISIKNDKGLTSAHILAKYISKVSSDNNSIEFDPKYQLTKNILCENKAANILTNDGLNSAHYLCLKNKLFRPIEALLDHIDIHSLTQKGEDIHDLLYRNKNLSKPNKQALIYDYFVRVNNSIPVNIVENNLDEDDSYD